MDRKPLLKMTTEVNIYLPCKCCKQIYLELWDNTWNNTIYNRTGITSCYFCNNFLPMRDSKIDLLNKINKCYLEYNKIKPDISQHRYYNDFIDSVNKWCKHWSIITTPEEQKVEYMLRNIK